MACPSNEIAHSYRCAQTLEQKEKNNGRISRLLVSFSILKPMNAKLWEISNGKREKEREKKDGSRIELTKFLDTNVGRNNRSFDRWINSHGWMEIISFMEALSITTWKINVSLFPIVRVSESLAIRATRNLYIILLIYTRNSKEENDISWNFEHIYEYIIFERNRSWMYFEKKEKEKYKS